MLIMVFILLWFSMFGLRFFENVWIEVNYGKGRCKLVLFLCKLLGGI